MLFLIRDKYVLHSNLRFRAITCGSTSLDKWSMSLFYVRLPHKQSKWVIATHSKIFHIFKRLNDPYKYLKWREREREMLWVSSIHCLASRSHEPFTPNPPLAKKKPHVMGRLNLPTEHFKCGKETKLLVVIPTHQTIHEEAKRGRIRCSPSLSCMGLAFRGNGGKES